MILLPISNPPILENTSYHYCIEFEWQEYDNLFFSTRGISLPSDMEEEVPKRKAHFLGGRYCAHQALEMMHGNNEILPIKKGEEGAPIWPEGVIGSITHNENFVGAVVADKKNLRGVGIDTEKILGPQSVNMVEGLVATDKEKKDSISFDPFEYFTLIYSAKESIFKCLHPLVKKYIEFHDVNIDQLDFEKRTFDFSLLKSLNEEFKEGMSFQGRFSLEKDKLHTAFELLH